MNSDIAHVGPWKFLMETLYISVGKVVQWKAVSWEAKVSITFGVLKEASDYGRHKRNKEILIKMATK
jgi:hypothetical protein